MSIRDYNKNNAGDTLTNSVRLSSTTEKIQNLVNQLHDALPIIEAEFTDLENRQNVTPNNIFPIKMAALSDIYNATNILYEWYIEKAKR